MTSSLQPPPGFLRRHAKAIIASVALTIGLVWVMRAGALPILPPKGTLERVDAVALTLFVLAMLGHMLIKFGRYRFLIAPLAHLSMRRIMTISAISTALITLLPFRLGELARPALLREKGKLSGWAITGTVGAERIIDGVAFSILLLLGLALAPPNEPLPDHIGGLAVPAALVPGAAIVAICGFGVALLVMALFFWWRDFARKLTLRVVGVVSKSLAERLAETVSNVSDGLKFLPNLRYTVPYLITTALIILLEVWGLSTLSSAVGLPPLSFAQGAVLTGVLALGFALPNAPGFFGAIQLALYAGLAMYVSPAAVVHEGATLAFLFYITYLGLVLLLAVVALLVEYVSPEEPAASEQAA
jgi:uncharacterized membrane protein YbhN (UPF0104 family)